jgi:hypothetical protein
MAWEDTDHKMSKVAHGTPTDNPGPDQPSPQDRPTLTQGKKEKLIISNNKKRHAAKRVGCPES